MPKEWTRLGMLIVRLALITGWLICDGNQVVLNVRLEAASRAFMFWVLKLTLKRVFPWQVYA